MISERSILCFIAGLLIGLIYLKVRGDDYENH